MPIGLLFVVVGGVCRAVTALFSRARELEADAGAARLTGNPAALASALIALTSTPPDTIPLADLRRAATLDVFHIVAIGREYPLVHTYPPLRRRLKQLAAIEARLQSPGRG
jgi:heat shock protein HtpX